VLSVKTGQLSFVVSSLCSSLLSKLVEQVLLSVEAKLVQPASPCFQCNHMQVPENLPEWLLFDVLTLTLTADKDKDKDNQCCAAGPQSAVPAVRSTRGAVRGEGPPVLRVLRLNILWYLPYSY